MGLRDALVTAALGLLEADGEEPSLRAVARTAGVSAMAPYNHFPDKAGLMAAVARHGFETMGRLLAAADDRPDPREALIAQGVAFVAFARANPALFRLMYGHRYGGADTEAVWATYAILSERVASLLPPEAVGPATLACRSLVQGLATIAVDGRLAPARDEDIEVAVRLFVTGLCGSEARPPRHASSAQPADVRDRG